MEQSVSSTRFGPVTNFSSSPSTGRRLSLVKRNSGNEDFGNCAAAFWIAGRCFWNKFQVVACLLCVGLTTCRCWSDSSATHWVVTRTSSTKSWSDLWKSLEPRSGLMNYLAVRPAVTTGTGSTVKRFSFLCVMLSASCLFSTCNIAFVLRRYQHQETSLNMWKGIAEVWKSANRWNVWPLMS